MIKSSQREPVSAASEERPISHRGRVARWIAVAGGLGYFPGAPGTAGSLAGVLIFSAVFGIGVGGEWVPSELPGAGLAPLSPDLFLTLFAVLLVALCCVGIWASDRAERDFGRHDDGRIVIDEVVGQLVALAPLTLLLGPESDFLSFGVGLVTGFVLFRVFDIWKPGAVRWAERRFVGGLGVMADDLVAGLYAALGLCVLALAGGLS